MELIYQPTWFELDQPLLLDYMHFYYLTINKRYFQNGIVSDNNMEVKGNIKRIFHDVLGELIAFIPFGTTYRIIKNDYSILNIDADQNPGKIIGMEKEYIDWTIKIELDVIEETGLTSKKRFALLSRDDKIREKRELIVTIKNRYDILLDL